MSALDFSYARPGGAALTAAGVTSVGRYLGTDGRCITLPELTDYLNNGVSVWLVKENSSRGMLNGYGQGASDARDAQGQLDALGQSNAVVYFTADFDIQRFQFAAGDQYLLGVASVMPVSRIGLYAGIDYLNHTAALVTYRWKTASSSFDHGQTAAAQLHLIQTTGATPIPNTDFDIIVQADHGQVGTLGTTTAGSGGTQLLEDDMSAAAEAQIADIHALLVNGTPAHLDVAAFTQGLNAVLDVQARMMAATGGGWDSFDEIVKAVRFLKAAVDPTALSKAISDKVTASLPAGADATAIAAAVDAALKDNFAAIPDAVRADLKAAL